MGSRVACEVHRAEVAGGVFDCLEEHGDEFPGRGGRVGWIFSDDEVHANFHYLDTQPFDVDGVKDNECDDKEWLYFEDTVPFDEDEILDIEVVVLAEESQVFDGDDDILENEVMNLASETQTLGDGETQLLDEVCEYDRTQVLENVDDDELSVNSDNGEVDSRKGKSWQQNRSDHFEAKPKANIVTFSHTDIVVDFTLTVVPIQIFVEGVMLFAIEVLGR
ncbi:uncharacterized protein LOC106774883 [Vigna radiata var. radiata]|uniref:Uncharacterized protein LOC106774883 n=1 Tax=Vigna radiata var. radiata TaxID=3916 RepID=A0A3Q0FKK9_VIGRR|nr:uncharacterized protein LOC106774883 [Vigna radiata var. radiata]